MPNIQCTDFSNRRGSPFQKEPTNDEVNNVENFEVTHVDKNKQMQTDLLNKVNKKSAEIASSKPSSNDGFFTEVVTHGAFTAPKPIELNARKSPSKSPTNSTTIIPKSLLGFPSSANSLALEAKTDLESDSGISLEVKEKVITKLFLLANMVQHVYESKVRVAADFEKFKDKHLKDEVRREKEQTEQLYKLNMNFQSEVVQMIQQLKMDIGVSKGSKMDGDITEAQTRVEEEHERINIIHENADKKENTNNEENHTEIDNNEENNDSIINKQEINEPVINKEETNEQVEQNKEMNEQIDNKDEIRV